VEVLECKPLESAAKATAKVVNTFTKQAHKILKDHAVNRARTSRGEPPANVVLLRGAGVFPDLTSIPDKLHLKAAGIAGVTLIRGMFRMVGIDVLEVEGATGGLDTDMIAKADAALTALETYDLVVLHIKAPDLCGHDGNASEKIHVIERMDQMMGHLKARLSADAIVAITADHSTPVAVKDHSGDPVPLTVFGEGVRVDGVLSFDERSVAHGALGRLRGRELMDVLLDAANRSPKFGT
jgi:2,3-bisphosphoglycerate-independent phosphoglycerate mutase